MGAFIHVHSSLLSLQALSRIIVLATTDNLFNPKANGRLVWRIITDPKDSLSSRIKMKNLPSTSIIRPLWSKFMVFSTYIKPTVLTLTCISTTMKRSRIQSQTPWDHLFHVFGILFVYQFPISISRHCFLSLPIATLADGLLLSLS